jgi:hypothetical protein
MAAGLLQRALMVSMSDGGSLDTAQWIFVSESMTRYAAKVELMLLNQV